MTINEVSSCYLCEYFLRLFLPVVPHLVHVLHLIDLVASDLLQDVQVKLRLLLFEAVDLHEGHQRNDDIGQALHRFFFLLEVFVLDLELVLSLGVGLLTQRYLSDCLVVLTKLHL